MFFIKNLAFVTLTLLFTTNQINAGRDSLLNKFKLVSEKELAALNSEPTLPIINRNIPDSPEQISLAFAGDRAITITWFTHTSTNGQSGVYYGTTKNELRKSEKGKSQLLGSNEIRSFKTAPDYTISKNFKVAVIGDMGLKGSEDTRKYLESHNEDTSFLLHLGDISYADFSLLELNKYDTHWNNYKNSLQSISASKPYMVLPGNHDISCNPLHTNLCPEYQNNFAYYNNRFTMPFKESKAVNNMWYKTDFPNAPSQPGGRMGSKQFGDQLTWLENELKKSVLERNNVPWIVVSGHRPFYSVNQKEECQECREAFEQLFINYGVDLYLSGHVHRYERMFPMKNGQVTQTDYNEPEAPVHIISGNAGNIGGLDDINWHDYNNIAGYTDDTHTGFGELELVDSKTLRWVNRRSDTGEVIDQIEIIKSRHHRFLSTNVNAVVASDANPNRQQATSDNKPKMSKKKKAVTAGSAIVLVGGAFLAKGLYKGGKALVNMIKKKVNSPKKPTTTVTTIATTTTIALTDSTRTINPTLSASQTSVATQKTEASQTSVATQKTEEEEEETTTTTVIITQTDTYGNETLNISTTVLNLLQTDQNTDNKSNNGFVAAGAPVDFVALVCVVAVAIGV
eukprot:Pgem_evm1s13118